MRPILLAPARPLHKESKDHAASREVLKFFDWAYKNGDEMAEELDYIPMPDSVVDLVHKEWVKIKDKDGRPILAVD